MRKLFSANIPCEAGCRYCFAKWSDYGHQPDLKFESEHVDSDRIVLYPCCDGDFFEQDEAIESIKPYTEAYERVYVSLSSKIKPTDKKIMQLLGLNEWLMKRDKGFVKFAVSISNRSMLEELEPATMSYGERVELAGYIHSLGIPLSLTIKPVLPFITEEEYGSIMRDFSPYLDSVLIGGLYINKKSDFYARYIRDKYVCTKRKVEWLINHPEWDYVEDTGKMEKIKTLAKDLGLRVFDSDVALIKALVEGGS